MANRNWSVRTLSVPGLDTDLSLFVAFDNARFLFGAGENTQRGFIQKRFGMRGLQAIFLPDGTARGRNGLPGVLMTALDAGIRDIKVAGPPDLTQYISTLRGSVLRDHLNLGATPFPRASEAASEVVFDSEHMTVHAVALRPPEPELGAGAANGGADVATAAAAGPHERLLPCQMSPAELEVWTSGVVNDMFRGGQGPPKSPRPFPGVNRPGYPDDRYPLPVSSDADVATEMVYICRTPDVRGKFDVAKANALGVPNGPVRGELTRGNPIEVDDPSAPGGKRTIRPEDCLVGGGLGSVLIVVHCSEHNLGRLLASSAFAAYQTGTDGATPEVPVHCVVHRVPRSVWEDSRYQAWVASFGPVTSHMFADDQGTDRIFFNSSTWNTLALNMLDPAMFPVPHHSFEAPSPPTLPPNAAVLEPNHFIRMFPPRPLERLTDHEKDRSFPTTEAELEDARKLLREQSPEYVAAAEAARVVIREQEKLRAGAQTLPGDEIVVTTLGTGSAVPSKYRNVSSTHVDVPGVGGILLDAGEGTMGQLRRRFGPEGLKRVFSELRLLFISHMHADHHLGIASVLADRFRNGITSTLYLVAPHAIALQLQETAAWQFGVPREALENVKFISINRLRRPVRRHRNGSRQSSPSRSGTPSEGRSEPYADVPLESRMVEEMAPLDIAAGKRKWPFENVFRFHPDCNARANERIQTLLSDLGLTEMHAPSMPHRGAAYGLILTHSSGWKLAYSGDTKPTDTFAEAGRGATILIHEATIEDDKPEVAEAKGHSTFGQAIDIGRKMEARYVILNHFSQRYPKIPKLPPPPAPVQPAEGESAAPAVAEPTVAISFDYMSIKAADVWKVAHYMDALTILYAEEEDEAVDDEEAGGVEEGSAKDKGKQQAKGKGGKPNNERKKMKGQKGTNNGNGKEEGGKGGKRGKGGKVEGKTASEAGKDTLVAGGSVLVTEESAPEASEEAALNDSPMNPKSSSQTLQSGTKRGSDASTDEPEAKKVCAGAAAQ